MPVQNGDGNWDDDEVLVAPQTPSSTSERPHQPGPGAYEQTGSAADSEPHPVADEETPEEEKVEDDEPLPKFDDQYKLPLEGLLFIGKLQTDFKWLGHRFVIKTLNTDEILGVGLAHAKYANTLADVKAYQAAAVAACVVSVDGQPVAIPLTNNADDTEIDAKFQVVKQWFPPLLDKIYDEFLTLESTVTKVIDAMGKVSG